MPTTDLTTTDRSALGAVSRHDLYTDGKGRLWLWPDGVAQPADPDLCDAVARLEAAGLITLLPAGPGGFRWYELTDAGRAMLGNGA